MRRDATRVVVDHTRGRPTAPGGARGEAVPEEAHDVGEEAGVRKDPDPLGGAALIQLQSAALEHVEGDELVLCGQWVAVRPVIDVLQILHVEVGEAREGVGRCGSVATVRRHLEGGGEDEGRVHRAEVGGLADGDGVGFAGERERVQGGLHLHQQGLGDRIPHDVQPGDALARVACTLPNKLVHGVILGALVRLQLRRDGRRHALESHDLCRVRDVIVLAQQSGFLGEPLGFQKHGQLVRLHGKKPITQGLRQIAPGEDEATLVGAGVPTLVRLLPVVLGGLALVHRAQRLVAVLPGVEPALVLAQSWLVQTPAS
mmetsp:Transcript_35297/g.84625  ORF Transcript_35297/g.84625 Transcript_35297/m.84625 type:complete len:315 (-) Transcript_35297:1885-2829(-)